MPAIELLAPAKDLESGMAAFDCGADAVYIGAARFGARDAAGNKIEDIAALCEYAHKYYAKVYATVNTLLRDIEIEQALELINALNDVGVDGLIIQDVGLLECDLPPIPLIASTQMHNSSPERVAFLEKVGFKRAILARELNLDEIKAIRAATSLELECFIHGALCVCYSGQCYLSYGLGHRSGNRGQCAQPCRKKYDLFDPDGHMLATGKHLLSLKDLNLSDSLGDMLDAGVTSFKIEGRLKDRNYVSNVVSFYREKLDTVLTERNLQKASSGHVISDFHPDPSKTFNRGFTTYFLHDENEEVASIDSPKMMGEVVGTIESCGKLSFALDGNVEMNRGDGICFFDRYGKLRGTVVNDVRGKLITPDKTSGMAAGLVIHRNKDHAFLTSLAKAKFERLIDITLSLKENAEGFVLSARDEDGNSAEFAMDFDKEPAKNVEQAKENLESQLAKCGSSGFSCTKVELVLDEIPFMPMSAVNSLRRGALEALWEQRTINRPVDRGGRIVNRKVYPEKELSFTGNVLNSKAEAFYRRHGVTSIQPAAESGMDLTGERLMTTAYCIKRQLGQCKKSGEAGPETLYLVDEQGNRLRLEFDCKKCRMMVYGECFAHGGA